MHWLCCTPETETIVPVERKAASDVHIPKTFRLITDFVTGEKIPDVGAEANRQTIERILVTEKGYAKEDIEVDAPLEVTIGDEPYRSSVDLVVSVHGKRYMVIKCAPGSWDRGKGRLFLPPGSWMYTKFPFPWCRTAKPRWCSIPYPVKKIGRRPRCDSVEKGVARNVKITWIAAGCWKTTGAWKVDFPFLWQYERKCGP